MTPIPDPQAFNAWRSRPGYTWLLKHSKICPESDAAHAEVSAYEKTHKRDPIGIVVVQDHKSASEAVAAAFGVTHESPQLFLIRDGKAIWSASHGGITQAAMEFQRLPSL